MTISKNRAFMLLLVSKVRIQLKQVYPFYKTILL
nr:MAG TPA: hypothetical protein [Caudoviricetes sp.]